MSSGSLRALGLGHRNYYGWLQAMISTSMASGDFAAALIFAAHWEWCASRGIA